MNREQREIIRSGKCVYYSCKCYFPERCIKSGCAEDAWRYPLRPFRADFGLGQLIKTLVLGITLTFAAIFGLVLFLGHG